MSSFTRLKPQCSTGRVLLLCHVDSVLPLLMKPLFDIVVVGSVGAAAEWFERQDFDFLVCEVRQDTEAEDALPLNRYLQVRSAAVYVWLADRAAGQAFAKQEGVQVIMGSELPNRLMSCLSR